MYPRLPNSPNCTVLYRQSIALFGILLPAVAAVALVGGVYMWKNSVTASFTEKQKHFKTFETNRVNALGIEARVNRKKQFMDQWKAQLAEETKSAVSANLRKIQESLPNKEFQSTAFDPINTPGGFGSVSAQRSAQIRLGFRGTYRTMQRAFLALETQMPQLQLQELKIDPSSNQSSLLNFDVTYTAWEN